MIETAPSVSVVIIFLDPGARFLGEAIDSVREQTFDDWELILVDDGSTDDSSALARSEAAAEPERIRYVEHPSHANLGMSASRNRGLAEARGRYIAFLDADDAWLPRRLERHVELLERDAALAAVYGPTRYWYSWTGGPEDAARDVTRDLMVEPDRRYEPPTLLLRWLRTRGGATTCPTNLTVRHASAIAVGGFEEQFRGLGEDQAFLTKLRLNWPIFVLGEPLALYRQHPASCTEQALAAGSYHLKRPNHYQGASLDWLDGYLASQGVRDQRLLWALRWQQLPYRIPVLFPLINLPHRVRDAVDLARRLWRRRLADAVRFKP